MQSILKTFSNLSTSKQLTKLLVLLVILIIVIGGSFFAWDYFVNQKLVTLNPSPGTTIAIGERSGDELAISRQIVSTSTKKSIRLRNGVYIVKYAGTSDYQDVTESIIINKSTEIKTPSLDYTDNKLSQLLETENAAIQNVIAPIILNQNYNVDSGTLIKDGNWYGARLKPTVWYDPTMAVKIIGPVSGDSDMLRVILKKTKGQWEVVAGPSVIFAIDDYPDIPPEVIRATNKLGFN